MPLIIQCTSGHKMSVSEDYVGKRVRCPRCQEIVTVQAPAATAPALPAPPRLPQEVAGHVTPGLPAASVAPPPVHDRGYDAPDDRPPRDAWDDRGRHFDLGRNDPYDRDDDRDGIDHRLDAEEIAQLQTVSLGLSFVAWRYLLWIFVLLLWVGSVSMIVFVEEFGRRRGMRGDEAWRILVVILSIIAFLLFLVQLVFTFIGSGMCCRAPQRSGAKGLIVSALICDGLVVFSGLLIFLLAIIAGIARGRAGEPFAFLALGVGVIATVCFIAAQVLMHLFLRRMSMFVHDQRNAGSAISTMILWLVFLVGGVVIAFVLGFTLAISRARPETVAMVMFGFAWINTLLLILAYSLLIGVISRLRRRIASEIHGSMR